ncbi:hypothetical protein BDN72DRAFT_410385 [Pluteus cervinus]|uniref:Uncharacterized protein n=1 Tax=Pluteus cervinus TaxID=181527 RepID=A0ACD3B2L6_9AGAR|nr:hypothetical protein BDN72DRAFT_410385 [Pluteus cervinus]
MSGCALVKPDLMFNPLTFLLLLNEAIHASLLWGQPIINHLQGRQGVNISTVPPPCVQDCTDFVTYTQICGNPPGTSNPTCGCIHETIDYIVDCFNCLISYHITAVQLGQGMLDQWIDRCNAAGVDLPNATVNGGISHATSVHQNNIHTVTRPSTTMVALPTPSGTNTGLPIGANSKGGSGHGQTGDGVVSIIPQTLFGVVLSMMMLSASILL